MELSKLFDWISIVRVLCVFWLCPAALVGQATSKDRPNFIIFVVDDLGWGDLGCYGSSFYETPQIDSLAAEALRFTNGYAACPVCSPTRASFQTGRNPTRLHTTDWFGGPQPGEALRTPLAKKFKNRPLLPANYLDYLPLQEHTIAEVLRQQGYRTFFAGKWHLGEAGYYPENQGYEFNLGGNEMGSPPGGYFSPYKNHKLADGPVGEHLPDRLATESVRFLENLEDDSYLLVLSFYSVHNPQQGRKDLVAKYRAKAASLATTDTEFSPEGKFKNRQVQNQPVYAAMVEAVDQAVGKVLTSLKELGLEENTIVLFTSDNGGLNTAEGSPTSNSPLRAGKGWLYEGGIRVPWIVKWPGVTKSATACHVPVISDDIMPTLLEVAGAQAITGAPLDGRSFVPLLRNPEAKMVRNLFWHYPHSSNQGGGPGGAMRSGKWKLIEWFENQKVELYDLNQDLGESRDLAAAEPETTQKLHSQLMSWRESLDAEMPAINPLYSIQK